MLLPCLAVTYKEDGNPFFGGWQRAIPKKEDFPGKSVQLGLSVHSGDREEIETKPHKLSVCSLPFRSTCKKDRRSHKVISSLELQTMCLDTLKSLM